MDETPAHDPVAVPLVGVSMTKGRPDSTRAEKVAFARAAPHLANARRPVQVLDAAESYDFTPPSNAPAMPGPGRF